MRPSLKIASVTRWHVRALGVMLPDSITTTADVGEHAVPMNLYPCGGTVFNKNTRKTCFLLLYPALTINFVAVRIVTLLSAENDLLWQNVSEDLRQCFWDQSAGKSGKCGWSRFNHSHLISGASSSARYEEKVFGERVLMQSNLNFASKYNLLVRWAQAAVSSLHCSISRVLNAAICLSLVLERRQPLSWAGLQKKQHDITSWKCWLRLWSCALGYGTRTYSVTSLFPIRATSVFVPQPFPGKIQDPNRAALAKSAKAKNVRLVIKAALLKRRIMVTAPSSIGFCSGKSPNCSFFRVQWPCTVYTRTFVHTSIEPYVRL